MDDAEDAYANDSPMETPNRFPQGFGNLAQTSRFPHSHSQDHPCGVERREEPNIRGQRLDQHEYGGASQASDGAWTVAGAPLDPTRDYRVVFNDYVLNGNERGLEWIKPETSGITVLPDAPNEFRRAVIQRLATSLPAPSPRPEAALPFAIAAARAAPCPC